MSDEKKAEIPELTDGVLEEGISGKAETWKDEHNRLYGILRTIDVLRDLVGTPLPINHPALGDIGNRTAAAIANELCRELTVMRVAVEHQMKNLVATYGGGANTHEAQGDDVLRELRGFKIYLYADPDPAPGAPHRFTIGATFDHADLFQAGRIFVGEFGPEIRPSAMASGEPDAGRPAVHAMVHLGTRFDIGQQVVFNAPFGQGDGVIKAITQYGDREPSYIVRPGETTATLLEHDHDVVRDEGEIVGSAAAAGVDGRDEAVDLLTQAIACGLASWDEIGPIVENHPRLAHLLCRGLDRLEGAAVEKPRSVADLRRETMEGQLTGRRLIRALAAVAGVSFTRL